MPDWFQDIWPFIVKIIFNWLWLFLGVAIGVDSRLNNLYPRYKIWRDSQPQLMRYLLLSGLVIAGFLIFHDAKTETRNIRVDCEVYKKQVVLEKMETISSHVSLLEKVGSNWGFPTQDPIPLNFQVFQRKVGESCLLNPVVRNDNRSATLTGASIRLSFYTKIGEYAKIGETIEVEPIQEWERVGLPSTVASYSYTFSKEKDIPAGHGGNPRETLRFKFFATRNILSRI